MTKNIDGRKAEITNSLQVYTNWVTLATEHGYPKAAYVYGSDPRVHLNDGDTVTLLTSTFAHDGALIWVVQARNGEQFLYSEKGLRILPHEYSAPIPVLPDESLSGLSREYREVKREANVGERIVTDKECGHYYRAGDVGKVTIVTNGRGDVKADFHGNSYVHDDGVWYVGFSDIGYVVLEPTEILVIDNVRYTMADRKAAVGERVIMTRGNSVFKAGTIITVHEHAEIGSGGISYVDGTYGTYGGGKYAVLEPVEPAVPAPLLSDLPAESQAAATISALTLLHTSLALRLTQAEAKITALERKVASGPVDNTPPSFAKRGPHAITYAEVRADLLAARDTARERKAARKSPQQIRDEIVERAKADVITLENTYRANIDGNSVSFWPKACAKDGYLPCHSVEYVINRDKRTVVALIQYDDGSGVAYRGIAKCVPGETFNSHIGRAIALHRALGLEVPAEYLDAPGPTEVRVGDIIKYDETTRGPLLVRDVAQNTSVETFLSTAQHHFEELTVLDDSRENGGRSGASSALKGAA